MTRTDKILDWLKNNKFVSVVIILAIIIAGLASTLKNVGEIADFFGFNKSDSINNQPKKDSIYLTIPLSQIEGIATGLLKEKPEFYGYQNVYGENYILTFTKSDNRFTLFKQFDNLWEDVQYIDSVEDRNMFLGPEDWQFTVIDSLPTLFYATGGFGNTFGSVDFFVIPFKKDFSYNVYNVNVDGRLNESVDGYFFDNTDYTVTSNGFAKQKDAFAAFLQQKFNKYNPVIPLTPEEADLDNPKNALKAWEVENSDWIKQIEARDDSIPYYPKNMQVKFKYYKDDLNKFISSEEDSAVEPDDENENYRLYNYFKYASIVQNKKSGEYFIGLGYNGWSAGKIKLQNDSLYVSEVWYFDAPFLIDLKTGNVKFLPKPKDTF